MQTTPKVPNVLITGESGTGKELVADAIHNTGDTQQAPFIAINCTVLPEPLLESELFGHEKGAFTGAHDQKLGKFEIARTGSLLLDEIGDMSPRLQQKLLRVIEERSFQRVGGNESIPVHARFIAATNRNLEEEIKRGRFREDLYFRLNVIRVKLPALQERAADIPLLANYFLAKYTQKLNKNMRGISTEVLDALCKYHFPGNVRELENLIQRAVVMEKSDVLSTNSFPFILFQKKQVKELDIPILHENLGQARQAVIEAFEQKFVRERLRLTRGNVTEAAKTAGIERQSFQRLMKKYSIQSEDFRQK